MIDRHAADAPFTGVLADFAGGLRWVEEKRDAAESAAQLQPHLLRFQTSIGGPWRPACSLWCQTYINTLLIPALCMVARDWRDDLCASHISASFCSRTGAPCGFRVHAERRDDPTVEAAFLQLIETHVRLVIDDVAEAGGLSKRMLWESVDLTVRWTVGEIAAAQPDRVEKLWRLAQGSGPGSRLLSSCASAVDPKAAHCAARRFCCLRYQVAGRRACPAICPRGDTCCSGGRDHDRRGRDRDQTC